MLVRHHRPAVRASGVVGSAEMPEGEQQMAKVAMTEINMLLAERTATCARSLIEKRSA
jgi:hypothetical protein